MSWLRSGGKKISNLAVWREVREASTKLNLFSRIFLVVRFYGILRWSAITVAYLSFAGCTNDIQEKEFYTTIISTWFRLMSFR